MRLTHSLCTNWDISTGVDVDDERHRVLIGQVSHRLDDDQLWGVSLWRLPEENPEKGLSVGWPQEYLQAAGAGDRMAMDIRVSTRTTTARASSTPSAGQSLWHRRIPPSSGRATAWRCMRTR